MRVVDDVDRICWVAARLMVKYEVWTPSTSRRWKPPTATAPQTGGAEPVLGPDRVVGSPEDGPRVIYLVVLAGIFVASAWLELVVPRRVFRR